LSSGVYPHWASNGRELLYEEDSTGRILFARYHTSGDSFVLESTGVWSEQRMLNAFPGRAPFDVSPDGHMAAVLYSDGTVDRKPVTSLTFLANFFDELRARTGR
jgi:hypothetical protein